MSNDVGMFIVNNCIDLVIDEENFDLKGDDTLETSVIISLFTDIRVEEEELIYGQEKKRGWWGDPLNDVDQDQIGSRMWLLERGKRTQTDLNRLIDYAKAALNWMLEDGVASTVEVEGSFDSEGQTLLDISITKPNQVETRFSVIWDAQEIRR